MMNKKWAFLMILPMAALIALSSLALAYQGPRRHLKGGIAPVHNALKAVVNLTPEQQEQIKTLRETYRPRIGAARKELQQARRDLREALSSAEAESSVIQPLIEKVAAAHSELIRLQANLNLEVNQILTPEQRARVKEFRERMKSLFQEHRREREALIREFSQRGPN